MPDPSAFELSAVAHLIRPWGKPAHDLEQLRQGIASAPDEVLFHHAVQYPLRHPGADELPPDDFSAWIFGVVQDAETAERLSFAAQSGNTSADSVRAALLEVLDAVPAKRRLERDAPEGSDFPFLSATTVSFPTGIQVRDGQELVDALVTADASIWFFHLIEEPWFHAGRSSLLEWLAAAGDLRLVGWLREAAVSALPIEKARAHLHRRWRRSQIGRQIARATAAPEDVRREVARETVARFVRRAAHPNEGS